MDKYAFMLLTLDDPVQTQYMATLSNGINDQIKTDQLKLGVLKEFNVVKKGSGVTEPQRKEMTWRE